MIFASKSTLKLNNLKILRTKDTKKILQICLRSFANPHPVVREKFQGIRLRFLLLKKPFSFHYLLWDMGDFHFSVRQLRELRKVANR